MWYLFESGIALQMIDKMIASLLFILGLSSSYWQRNKIIDANYFSLFNSFALWTALINS